MSTTEKDTPTTTVIDLAQLPLEQLQAVRQQIEEEIQHLTESYSALKLAQTKFNTNIDCINTVKKIDEGNNILVPLTVSLYVPGQLVNKDKLIVDVGTGYYVEKNLDDAKKFFEKKNSFLKDNLSKLQKSIISRQDQNKAIIEVLQVKLNEAQKEKAKAK
ncbi:Prefoldin alpha subunit [Neocallimastix lanati (nom. inval.)]|jgi:prefoldin alpha subunit|uniref:Prefoldin alpha subunit n=1 Tax=Neocallimastix californiae TaxID=1754190 RepID=A0A1Y2AZ35_9FUNG|nr:Prefoldin alpha subunit [Neocallimastix sp. JGI-2020a]ORY27838.1 Prefoldin alpha subunit [Neocallimastix californiae]|eukprot:ORY27838.1 Prefoldin alpha subunit [Neocallimastix californiae]